MDPPQIEPAKFVNQMEPRIVPITKKVTFDSPLNPISTTRIQEILQSKRLGEFLAVAEATDSLNCYLLNPKFICCIWLYGTFSEAMSVTAKITGSAGHNWYKYTFNKKGWMVPFIHLMSFNLGCINCKVWTLQGPPDFYREYKPDWIQKITWLASNIPGFTDPVPFSLTCLTTTIGLIDTMARFGAVTNSKPDGEYIPFPEPLKATFLNAIDAYFIGCPDSMLSSYIGRKLLPFKSDGTIELIDLQFLYSRRIFNKARVIDWLVESGVDPTLAKETVQSIY